MNSWFRKFVVLCGVALLGYCLLNTIWTSQSIHNQFTSINDNVNSAIRGLRQIWPLRSFMNASSPGEKSELSGAHSGDEENYDKTITELPAVSKNRIEPQPRSPNQSKMASGPETETHFEIKYKHLMAQETNYTTNVGLKMRLRNGTNRESYLKNTIGQVVKSSGNPSLAEQLRNSATKPYHQKYLIYVCDWARPCRGWADRQWGLVSAFLLSLATERKFGIIMTKPCNVTNFYVPNDVNWTIPNDELRGKQKVTIDDLQKKQNLSRRLRSMNFNHEYPQDVVYIRTNIASYWRDMIRNKLYSKKLPEWAHTSRSLVFAKAWTCLMRPSEGLQHRLDNYLKNIHYQNRTNPLVCCHVRIGQSKTGIIHDSARRTNISDLPVLWDFLQPYTKNGSLVFMATDDNLVRKMARRKFGDQMSDTGGKILHVDVQAGARDACEGFMFAVLDQLILTYCDVLIRSFSGFGLNAASVRGRNENLFLFTQGLVRPTELN